MNLTKPSIAYKPFKYTWAIDYWDKQQKMHWIANEISFAQDLRDWNTVLKDGEIEFLSSILRFFTQSDIDVASGYVKKYLPIFNNNEIRMMLLSFANMETIHIQAYAIVLETLGLEDQEFCNYNKFAPMKNKHDFLDKFPMNTEEDILKGIAVYGAFTEGLQLFGSFAMLLNFQRFGLMKGMGQVITYSMRDESLHTQGVIQLYHQYAKETGALTPKIKDDIYQIAEQVVKLEMDFIELAYECGSPRGLTLNDMKDYVYFLCNFRLNQLGLKSIYKQKTCPLQWLNEFHSGNEHTNFFENTSTEYTKSSTQGDWHSYWNGEEIKMK